jgi:hypothetical protein
MNRVQLFFVIPPFLSCGVVDFLLVSITSFHQYSESESNFLWRFEIQFILLRVRTGAISVCQSQSCAEILVGGSIPPSAVTMKNHSIAILHRVHIDQSFWCGSDGMMIFESSLILVLSLLFLGIIIMNSLLLSVHDLNWIDLLSFSYFLFSHSKLNF